eukprot:14524294-Alexandrium_andersonii.AAC.1
MSCPSSRRVLKSAESTHTIACIRFSSIYQSTYCKQSWRVWDVRQTALRAQERCALAADGWATPVVIQ